MATRLRLACSALLITAGSAWGAPSAFSQQDASAPRVPVVVTTGEAVVRRAPDQAHVEFAVETRAPSPKTAAASNATTMETVQQRLRSMGIAAEAMQTRAYDLHEDFDFVNGKRVSRGFVARNTIEVRVDQIERVGEIIDAGIAAGTNSVGSVRFDLKDRENVEREALKRAVTDARERANAAAAGAGLSVSRVVRIEESRTVTHPPVPLMRMAAQEMDSAATPVAPGEIEVRAMVTLTAEVR
jgi:uncharacterized protein YggE